MVFFQFDDENMEWFGASKGHWVWTHGILYLATGPAQLHAISGGLLDPVWFTVMKSKPKPGSECLKLNGDHNECAMELLKDEIDDLKDSIPLVRLASRTISQYLNSYIHTEICSLISCVFEI